MAHGAGDAAGHVLVTLAFVSLFGLVIGSFLNVVIVRLPRGRSLLGRSACPRCGAPIAARDNIPVLSFALLSRRCRACRAPISWQYPLVEVATAAAFDLAFLRFGLTPAFALACALLAALVAVTAIDLEHQIIPDAITLPGLAAGAVLRPLTGLATRPDDLFRGGPVPMLLESLGSGRTARLGVFLDSLLGILVCGGLLWLVIAVSGWFYARRHPALPAGMGGGDMKLAAMLGAFLGWRLGLFALYVAVMAGGVVAAALLLARRKRGKDAVPFGPFLALGGATALLAEPPDSLGL
jgi:leader peptidase (prepilin peptidase)/N-methyltransferase